MMNRPSGIGFDFDHTLGVDNGLERRALYDVAAGAGRPISERDENVRTRVDELLAGFRGGAFDIVEMLRRFSAERGIPDIEPQRWRERCYALVDELVRPMPGARETIALLRERGVPLAILTNGWSPLQQMKIARALGADTIDIVLVSDEIGSEKPQAAAFDALVAALGGAREATWYVGDNARTDVGGALAAGLQAMWFDWEGQAYPPDLPPPSGIIHALRELEALTENASFP
jgi:5'-nucleotidase